MTNKEIFDRIIIIQEKKDREKSFVTEALSLKDDLDAFSGLSRNILDARMNLESKSA